MPEDRDVRQLNFLHPIHYFLSLKRALWQALFYTTMSIFLASPVLYEQYFKVEVFSSFEFNDLCFLFIQSHHFTIYKEIGGIKSFSLGMQNKLCVSCVKERSSHATGTDNGRNMRRVRCW